MNRNDNSVKSEPRGIIGRTFEDNFPVIFKLVDELPDETTVGALPSLTVISWKYDGSSNNGMPTQDAHKPMKDLELAIESEIVREDFCRHAFSRTGNGLKELVYYVADRDAFMSKLNAALCNHPRYPIEIDFYDDPQWDSFIGLLNAFRKSG